jgi:hypothetical protein
MVPTARDRIYCEITAAEMIEYFATWRLKAYEHIFGDASTNNCHLRLIHSREKHFNRRTLEQVLAGCINDKVGFQKSTGLTTTQTGKPHHLITWLVYLLTNCFYLQTNRGICSKSYSQMLILARNNGNRGLKEVEAEHFLYHNGETAGFKVCLVISH